MNATHGYSADAELIRVCEEFEVLERAYRVNRDCAAGQGENADLERAADEIIARQETLQPAMLDLPATSRKAMQARARALAIWAPEILDDGGDLSGKMVAAIVRDLVGSEWLADLLALTKCGAPNLRAVIAGPWVPTDVYLISACAELIRKQELLTRIVDGDSDEDVDFDAPEIAKLYDDRDALIRRVTTMGATTRAGYVYKAKAALAVSQLGGTNDLFADLAYAALSDVAATKV